jgi:hypothetical protein
MRPMLLAGVLLALAGAAWARDVEAGGDSMASRYGNTTVASDPDGTKTMIFYRADHTFLARRETWQSKGRWEIKDGKLCLYYAKTRPGVGDSECVSAEAHQIGEVWHHNGRSVTLVKGLVFEEIDRPPSDAVAEAAARARVGNTVVATDADGTATHIFWRADRTFSAWQKDWKSEGKWFVADGKLCLTYDIPRPKLGASECMANAQPHEIGDVWQTDGRRVTLLKGRQ